MIARKALAAGVIAVGALLTLTGPARADTLALTCQALSSGNSTSCGTTAPAYAVPGLYNYADTLSASEASGKIPGSDIYGGPAYGNLGPAGFIDAYLFQISPASADAVSATISNGSYAVSNLFAQLYSLSANQGGLVLGTPAGEVYYGVVTDEGAATYVQINPVTLAAGSYVLEISGTSSGSAGGGYTGSLNLSPVPLPPSFPLLLTGLLGFAGLILPRSRNR